MTPTSERASAWLARLNISSPPLGRETSTWYLKTWDAAPWSVASWLVWNGLRITRKIRVPGASRRPALRDAHIPTQEELRRVLNVAGPKARTATALMAFSGMRPETMGTYLGDDGLRIGDLVEASVDGGVLTFRTVPTMILVPERLS